ncbi:hypothetical protein [Citrobacter freundii]|uniref:hypothetical protein n=1 Tax=Citrobacter freundii TaxID=546 RepID=UPI001EEFDAEC|nr:hypothetical protein [Citrobacter freundii]
MLRNLKEAPESSGRLIPLAVQTSANTGSRIIATEAKVSTPNILLLRQNAGLSLYHAGILPASQHLLIFSAFSLTGCGLHCRQALLPRGRRTAPETPCFSTAPDPCVTLTAQSGKVTHVAFSTCTR